MLMLLTSDLRGPSGRVRVRRGCNALIITIKAIIAVVVAVVDVNVLLTQCIDSFFFAALRLCGFDEVSLMTGRGECEEAGVGRAREDDVGHSDRSYYRCRCDVADVL